MSTIETSLADGWTYDLSLKSPSLNLKSPCGDQSVFVRMNKRFFLSWNRSRKLGSEWLHHVEQHWSRRSMGRCRLCGQCWRVNDNYIIRLWHLTRHISQGSHWAQTSTIKFHILKCCLTFRYIVFSCIFLWLRQWYENWHTLLTCKLSWH